MTELRGSRGLIQGIGLSVASLAVMLGIVLIANVDWYGPIGMPAGLLLIAGGLVACRKLFRIC